MAAVQMQPPPAHRPSMDRSASFDSSRRPFLATYDRPTSPFPRASHSPSPLGQSPHHLSSPGPSHSLALSPSPQHSRSSSTASSAHHPSPYAQPYGASPLPAPAAAPSYFTHHPGFVSPSPPPGHFPPVHAHPHAHPQASAWTATPIPATAFYASVPSVGQAGFTFHPTQNQVFHPGFQQSQADFAAWANAAAYQHMMMASMHQQQQQQQQQEFLASHSRPHSRAGGAGASEDRGGEGEFSGLPLPPKAPFTADEMDQGRKRTSSGPASHPSSPHHQGHQRHQSLDERDRSPQSLTRSHLSSPSLSSSAAGVGIGVPSASSVLATISQNYQHPQQRQVSDPTTTTRSHSYSYSLNQAQAQSPPPPAQQQAGGFHPYKRTPGHKPSRENVKQGSSPIVLPGTAIPRSKSQPSLGAAAAKADRERERERARASGHVSAAGGSGDGAEHQRTSSLDSPPATVRPAGVPARSEYTSGKQTSPSDRESEATPASLAVPAASATTSPPAPTKPSRAPPAPAAAATPTPLKPGPITAAATNHSQPSPLPSPSKAPTTGHAHPEAEKKSSSGGGGGLKSRLAKALHRDKAAREQSAPTSNMSASSSLQSIASMAAPSPSKTQSSAPRHPSTPTAAPAPKVAPSASLPHSHTYPSPSETSTRSGTPPQTPPQPVHHGHPAPAAAARDTLNNGHSHTDFAPPSAPFAIHSQALSSEVSLAETGRTEKLEDEKKSKRGLFRLKNRSTDNISLSSTVSSASMMIRKMGSLGKLARRNSLMGISKIFKDKPKDEDAALPETDGKKLSKKEKKDKEKDRKRGKGEPAPAEISRASAEADDDDRALAGLSPAAKLARQHTLKSKADEAKRLSAQQQSSSPLTTITGEPTWDKSTVGRSSSPLPSLAGVLPAPFPNGQPGYSAHHPIIRPRSSSASGSASGSAPEVLHVQPRNVPSVHRAVAVSDAEYDSADDDSSDDGETIEDVTFRMDRSRISGESGGSARLSADGWRDGREEERDKMFREEWGNAFRDRNAVPKKGILKSVNSSSSISNGLHRRRSNSAADHHVSSPPLHIPSTSTDPALSTLDGLHHPQPLPSPRSEGDKDHLNFSFDSPYASGSEDDLPSKPHAHAPAPQSPTGRTAHFAPAAGAGTSPYANPAANTSAPILTLAHHLEQQRHPNIRSMTVPARKRILWAPECAVFTTYDAGTYDRRSEPATCNRLTPELAMAIKQELNAFKMEMPVHPSSKIYTHYFQ